MSTWKKRAIGIVAAAGVGLGTAAVATAPADAAVSGSSRCTMSHREYHKIKNRMTPTQVRRIVGCRGKVSYSSKDVYDGETHTYVTIEFAKSTYASTYGTVTFYDGHAYDKSYSHGSHYESRYWG